MSNSSILSESDLMANVTRRIAYMINEESVQFNIVSKNLGCERMAFFLNQAALDIKEIMSSELKAKL